MMAPRVRATAVEGATFVMPATKSPNNVTSRATRCVGWWVGVPAGLLLIGSPVKDPRVAHPRERPTARSPGGETLAGACAEATPADWIQSRVRPCQIYLAYDDCRTLYG